MTDPLRLQTALGTAAPIYILPADDAIEEVVVPAFRIADSVDCMMGFFSSASLSQIAPGLAEYLTRTDQPLRLVISPYLNDADRRIVERTVDTDVNAIREIGSTPILGSVVDQDRLVTHTLDCLAWLLKQNRLQIKIALLRTGLFHPKVWLFRCDGTAAAMHGSSNMTGMGLGINLEQLTLSRDWTGAEAAQVVERLSDQFSLLWSGGNTDCRVVDLSEAVKNRLLAEYGKGSPPTGDDFKLLRDCQV